MFVGFTVSVELSLLDSDTVTPPGRAGFARNTDSPTDSPGDTISPAASEMSEAAVTFTVAVAFGTLGAPAAAVIVAEPAPAPFTGTLTLVALAAKPTEAGTVAAATLLEVRETVRPAAGAGDDRVKVRLFVPGPLIVKE